MSEEQCVTNGDAVMSGHDREPSAAGEDRGYKPEASGQGDAFDFVEQYARCLCL